jgi:hypothetical protein
VNCVVEVGNPTWLTATNPFPPLVAVVAWAFSANPSV